MERNSVKATSGRAQLLGPFLTASAATLLGAATILAGGSHAVKATPRSDAARPVSIEARAAAEDTAAVRRVLDEQAGAWNRGDLDAFAEGYWKSDATAFAGTQGILRGWQALVERYHRSYPDRKAMGRLTFSELEVTLLCSDAALVLGHWHLDREAGPVGGVFSLVLRRFPQGWRIIADHTSTVPSS